MRPLKIGLALALTSVMALAQTNTPGVRKLSLEDCIHSALAKNLDLQIARYNPAMARADLKAAYGGYDPTMELGGRHTFTMSGGGFNSSIGVFTPPVVSDNNAFQSTLGGTLPWGLNYSLQSSVAESYGPGFDNSGGAGSITLSQPLLKGFWIDRTRLSVRVAKNRLKYSELNLRQTIMSTATTVEQAYYDLIYSREFVKVQQKAVELARQLASENKKRVEVGALAPLDEKQAESQAATSEAALIAARSTLATQENALKQLLNDDFTWWRSVELEPTVSLAAPIHVFDRQISWSKGLSQRPDLLQSRLDVEKQGIQLKYDYNQMFPELDLQGMYGHNAGGSSVREFDHAIDQMVDGSRPTYYYGGAFTFPLGNRSARATYQKSRMTKEQLLLTLKKLEQTIMVTIDNDIHQAKSGYEQVAATRAASEYAAQALDAEQKKLERGKSTTYTVLQMQRDLTAARGNEIQALVNYNKALSQLSLDEASTIDRLGIDVEAKW